MVLRVDLRALQIGDIATGHAHEIVRCDRKHVVPRTRRGPHLVVLQQIRIDEHPQMRLVTEGRHAAIGLGNLPALELNL